MQFQQFCGAADGDRFEPGTFDQDVLRREGDFGFGAAHDAADADGARAISVADHRDARIELALDAVERAHFFLGLRGADDDGVAADQVVIEGVERVA